MKYIRTKDGVWQYDRNKNVIRPSEDGKSIVYWLHFDKKEILKSADTIEELCDMFVVWLEGKGVPIEMPLSEKEQYEKMKEVVLLGTKGKLNIWLKLAIWTDKGLIYVAKMNRKGDLELL